LGRKRETGLKAAEKKRTTSIFGGRNGEKKATGRVPLQSVQGKSKA